MRLLTAVFILFTAVAPLYARGAQEDSLLTHADKLIAEKEYDEAVQLLSDYMKDNPDRFGEAQKRLKKIIKIREHYSQIANELLDVVEKTPEDSDRIIKLSDELLSIESPSNPATRRFLDQIRYLAEFRINSNRLNQIILAARTQLYQNNYSGALATYASGLDIYQAQYFAAGYGEEAENVAVNGLETIYRNISSFNALAEPIRIFAVSLAEFDSPNPPSPAEANRIYSALSPYLDNLSALNESFQQVKSSFETQLAIIQSENDETGDRSFLSFAGMLLSGPAGMREGMIGVLEQFWNLRIEFAETVLVNLVNRNYDSGMQAMRNHDYSAGISIFEATESYIATALELTRKSSSFFGSGGARNYMVYGEQINEWRVRNYLAFRIMNHGLRHLRNIGNLANRDLSLEGSGFPALASWQQGTISAQAAISQEQAVRQSYHSLVNELTVLEERIGAELEEYAFFEENLLNIPGGIGLPQRPLHEARELAAILDSRFKTMEYNSAVRRYTIATSDMERRVIQREGEFNQGNNLIRGITRQTEWADSYTAYYPTEGLEILNGISGNLETDIRDARALLTQYTAEEQRILEAREINGLYGSSRDLLARLLSIQSVLGGIMTSARNQVQQAASLRFEGDRLYQSAQTALNRNDFEGARNFLSRAVDQYRASRAIQESDSLRVIWDTQVVALNADIDRRENEVIVQYVRDQLTRARNFYFAGNIDQAETALVNAQNRWRITNTVEQPEVEYWLSLVRGALSLQSGRTIAPTAPLYAEMSQLLSDARRNYDEGVRLLNINRRTDGLARFSDAMEKTREVRLMFPMNHDARMLELRIEQQTDRTAFNNAFRQRLNEAIAGTKERNFQSYAELQDLAEINPGYAGLRAILTQAEIDMGLRPPPPNPADLARSAELTRSAEAHYNSRDATRMSLARTQLEEAIRLNPNNVQAQQILDQVLISTTGTGTIAIPQGVQDQYDVAFRMHTMGNYLQADAILQRLLQNPANQRYTIILELKRRNDAFL